MLIGLLLHDGSSSFEGHWTCAVPCPRDMWWLCSDDTAQLVGGGEAADAIARRWCAALYVLEERQPDVTNGVQQVLHKSPMPHHKAISVPAPCTLKDSLWSLNAIRDYGAFDAGTRGIEVPRSFHRSMQAYDELSPDHLVPSRPNRRTRPGQFRWSQAGFLTMTCQALIKPAAPDQFDSGAEYPASPKQSAGCAWDRPTKHNTTLMLHESTLKALPAALRRRS